MTNNIIKYLLIEHHSLLRDGFYIGLKHIESRHPNLTFQGVEIRDNNKVKLTINELEVSSSFAFVWINLDFPVLLHEGHNTPIMLLSDIQNRYPEARIIAVMGNTKVFSLRKAFQKVNPHCILELIDCDQQTIINTLDVVIEKKVYYSPTILKLLHKFLKTFDKMDQADYCILHELSIGTPVTALPDKVFLSHSTILSRRIKLKELFKVNGKSDIDLINEVKMQGYV